VSLRPRKGQVLCLATHESRIAPPPTGGVLVSETTDTANWYARVIGVGEGVADLEFGDVVMLSNWTSACEGGWWSTPTKTHHGQPSPTERYEVHDPDGSGRAILASGYDRWVWVRPDQIICLVAPWATMMGGEGLAPGYHPLADRVLVEHRPHPARSTGGVEIARLGPAQQPVARVVEAAPGVTDVAAGQWVLVPPLARGTLIEWEDGRAWSLVHVDEILGVYDGEPPADVEWAFP
jgi:co-chaperonin GroES (HSP10)